jgi:hypothetical protein
MRAPLKCDLEGIRQRWQQLFPHCDREGCRRQRRWWQALSRGGHGLRLRTAWYCSVSCFEAALERTMARLHRPAMGHVRSAPHRVPLGLLLLSRGQLTNRQLRQALEAQQSAGAGRIGDWLQRLGFATEQQITSALGLQWSCPVFPLERSPENECAQIIPLPLLRDFRMLPVHFTPATRVLLMAFCDRIDYSMLYLIERMLDCHTEPCLVGPSAWDASLAALERRARCDEIVFDRECDPAEMARITRSYLQRLNADDLHLAACGSHLWVRLICADEAMNLIFRTGAAAQIPTVQLKSTPALPMRGLAAEDLPAAAAGAWRSEAERFRQQNGRIP